MSHANFDLDRFFFGWGTAIALGVAAVLAAVGTVTAHTSIEHAQLGRVASSFLLVCAVATSVGAITLFVSMWIYWVKCDRSPKTYRLIWFFVLLFGLFSGAPQVLYYLVVYLPGVRNKLQWERGERSV